MHRSAVSPPGLGVVLCLCGLGALLASFAVLALPAVSAVPASAATDEARQIRPAAGPTVVELFTSQGCSSCPPAERLLARMAAADDDLLLLAFHVDYWNYLGWKDLFSDERWSRRQEEYAGTLPAGRLYTPQAVVQGAEHCVGSRRDCLDLAIAKARRKGPGFGPTAALEGRVTISGDAIQVDVLGHLPGAVAGPLALEIVAYENELTTQVAAGENATLKLSHHGVVRALRSMELGPSALSDPTRNHEAPGGTGRFVVAPAWEREHLGFAALLRDRRDGRVLASWDSGVGAAISRSDR